MKIRIKGYLTFRKTIGDRVLNLDENEKPTLAGLLITLLRDLEPGEEVYQAESDLVNNGVIVLVNGLPIKQLPDKLDTILKDNDEIAIFPPMVGG